MKGEKNGHLRIIICCYFDVLCHCSSRMMWDFFLLIRMDKFWLFSFGLGLGGRDWVTKTSQTYFGLGKVCTSKQKSSCIWVVWLALRNFGAYVITINMLSLFFLRNATIKSTITWKSWVNRLRSKFSPTFPGPLAWHGKGTSVSTISFEMREQCFTLCYFTFWPYSVLQPKWPFITRWRTGLWNESSMRCEYRPPELFYLFIAPPFHPTEHTEIALINNLCWI